MAYGLTVYGDGGQVQVDDVSPTLAFLAKGSITLDQEMRSTTTPVFSRAYINSQGAVASAAGGMLCAFRARDNDNPIGVWGINPSDGSTSFVGYSQFGGLPVVDWWMFGRAPAPPTGTYGLTVYDDAGRVTWSSDHRPMRIAAAKNDVTALSNPLQASAPGDYAIAVGKPLGGVRSGSETPINGQFDWLECRPLWAAPSSTGFGSATSRPVRRLSNGSYPTGWRESDIRASLLLVDVSGL
ncbi:hypothetical protein [uncultured Brevundimonas sp.]|uniref:hypothetical protein n=1 Tax=uncultured Brevundimonas sp. TaxID=213418 RepID=UPI0025ED1B45|nr:hypothetical protein [uncultured Brevundimonas sp.]